MLCQVCKKNNAEIAYKTNINGKYSELFLCRECAHEKGIVSKNSFEPIDIIDDLFNKQSDDIFGGLFAGMMNDTASKRSSEATVCKKCGMRISDFLHGGKIGCAECYETFRSSIGSTIKRVHGKAEHCGKIPAGKMRNISFKNKISALKVKLDEAIAKQEYEMAAKYRDEIRELEKEEKGEQK